jgi:hypothetical protein
MKITLKWLIEKKACNSAIEAFRGEEEKEIDGITLVQKLISTNRLDFANWLIPKIINDQQERRKKIQNEIEEYFSWSQKLKKRCDSIRDEIQVELRRIDSIIAEIHHGEIILINGEHISTHSGVEELERLRKIKI